MLVKFKEYGDYIYVNPERVFMVSRVSEDSTVILSDAKNGITVHEPIDRVVMALNVAMGR